MGPGIGSVLVWTITDWLWTFLRRNERDERGAPAARR